MIVHSEPVMGTIVSFSIDPNGVAHEAIRRAAASACRALHRADGIFSTFEPESAISRLRNGVELGDAQCPPELATVAELCREARRASAGWFDPWRMPGGYDPTGLVKGWAAELALSELRRHGVLAAMVNAAGDIAVSGSPARPSRAWRVAVPAPGSAQSVAWSLDVGSAISTSGPAERGAHVIDPFARQATDRVRSATVVGASAAITDALATALAAGGHAAAQAISSYDGYEALWMEDGAWFATAAFPPATAHTDENTLTRFSPVT